MPDLHRAATSTPTASSRTRWSLISDVPPAGADPHAQRRTRSGSTRSRTRTRSGSIRATRRGSASATGDLVRVETEIGHFVVKAWVTEGIRPGVVACSHHMGRWKLGRASGQRQAMATVALDHDGDALDAARAGGASAPFESRRPGHAADLVDRRRRPPEPHLPGPPRPDLGHALLAPGGARAQGRARRRATATSPSTRRRLARGLPSAGSSATRPARRASRPTGRAGRTGCCARSSPRGTSTDCRRRTRCRARADGAACRALGARSASRPTRATGGSPRRSGCPATGARRRLRRASSSSSCYPYASVYLGAEGMLGGEARDRVAGFWRALGLVPPAEPDHLAALLGLYAALADAEEPRRTSRPAAAPAQARRALLHEHLLPVDRPVPRPSSSSSRRRTTRAWGALLARRARRRGRAALGPPTSAARGSCAGRRRSSRRPTRRRRGVPRAAAGRRRGAAFILARADLATRRARARAGARGSPSAVRARGAARPGRRGDPALAVAVRRAPGGAAPVGVLERTRGRGRGAALRGRTRSRTTGGSACSMRRDSPA